MPVAHSFHHALAAPRSQCRFHLFLQNHFDHFPHPLPYRRLQPLPQRSLLALFHCNASLRHGVFLLCPEPPLKRFRDFSFNYFSGEYAFLFFYRNRDRTVIIDGFHFSSPRSIVSSPCNGLLAGRNRAEDVARSNQFPFCPTLRNCVRSKSLVNPVPKSFIA